MLSIASILFIRFLSLSKLLTFFFCNYAYEWYSIGQEKQLAPDKACYLVIPEEVFKCCILDQEIVTITNSPLMKN